MTDFPHGTGGMPPSRSLVERAKAIILQPKLEWPVIDAEPSTIGGIYTSYVIPLAAIGPVCSLIGSQVFGYNFLGIHYKPPLVTSIEQSVLSFVLSLVMVYVIGLIVDALAPTFGGTKNPLAAFKVAAYSFTASWLAGAFQILPALGILAIVGLYSFYLLYLGLPRLMRTPESKAFGYTALVTVAAVVLFVIVGAITAAVARTAMGPVIASGGTLSGNLTVPGVGSVDVGKVEAAAAQAQLAAGQAQSAAAGAAATSAALSGDALKAMLPAALPGGFARTEVSSGGGQVAGIGGSNATGTYTSGDQHIQLSLTDMAAAGALAALGGALNIQSSHETATGYEKTGTVDGRMTTEKWDSNGHNGTYGTIVANRFNVEAEGNPASVDMLKNAVAAVDLGKLAAAVH